MVETTCSKEYQTGVSSLCGCMQRWGLLISGAVVVLGFGAGVAIGRLEAVPPMVELDVNNTSIELGRPATTQPAPVTTVAASNATETEATVTLAQRASTQIVVANTSGRANAARQAVDLLALAGWGNVGIRNPVVTDGVTRLFASAETLEVARQVALDLGLAGLTPEPLPAEPVLQGATKAAIIVLLGRDF